MFYYGNYSHFYTNNNKSLIKPIINDGNYSFSVIPSINTCK